MLRKLLHERPWAKAFELTGLPVMRRHKNRIRLKIGEDGTIGTETDTDSERDSESDSERETDTTGSCSSGAVRGAGRGVPRQDALDRAASAASSYSYVRYHDHRLDLDVPPGFEPYMAVRGDCTRQIFEETPSPSLLSCVVSPPPSKLDLSKLSPYFNQNESTDDSGFDVGGNKVYMACENLADIDHSVPIESLGDEDGDFLPTRRSFPHYSAKSDVPPKPWKSTEESCPHDDTNTDIQTVPSNVVEILDPPSPPGSPSVCDVANTDSIIIDPPPMFRNTEEDLKVINVNLNTNIPFRKHSLNSDKRIRRSVSKSMVEVDGCRGEEPARLSSQSERRGGGAGGAGCACCERWASHSPRSSDSGVVGSCTLASPELPDGQHKGSLGDLSQADRRKLTLSELEAARYEEQCRCTSPFGSTARSPSVASAASDPPPRLQRTSIHRRVDQYVPLKPLVTPKPDPPPRIYRHPSTHIENPKNVRKPVPMQWSTLNITERSKPSLHYHMRIYREQEPRPARAPRRAPADARRVRSRSADLAKLQPCLSEPGGGFVVYRSDLYAHWWMKAKLPITVVTDSDGHERQQ
ncbi:uncharacterized protein LOC105386151 isoform X7 [Plutella xylostella]|uniref:uncharacterized protein LOC105386151 isoform X7 n=1 Tax=Plutella xylostella TaxID=51655 RepID=UPI002032F179|nr:uncharacterized protein LOC105386151 isoform X7 [Plutella xylostella]